MYAEQNPFTPSFGRQPLYLAGRDLLLSDLSRALRSNGNDPYLQTIITGARGTGKTAVLTRACELASELGWVSASVTCGTGMLDDILIQSSEAASKLVAIKENAKIKGISVGQLFGIEWEPAHEAQANWRMNMGRLLDKLEEIGTGLVITVDEVRHNVPEMEELAAVFQHFVREDRRVALIMAGLPSQVSQLLDSESVSFLRRAMQVNLGRIADDEIRDALFKTVQEGGKLIKSDAVDVCVQAIGGFAYMMQLVGFRAWSASGESETIAREDAVRGCEAAKEDLERQVLYPTWSSLSKGDKAFCLSLAHGNRDAKAIAQDMNKKSNYVSKYKQRLIAQGVIEQDCDARLSFSLPGFSDFVLGLTQ